MPKLPVKYFKTVTEYVKYNWSGAIDKLYPVVKTVTKDFTRTDPVYVRIGEDGEPEIHYNLINQTGADSLFRGAETKASLILSGCDNLTSMTATLMSSYVTKITFQSPSSTKNTLNWRFAFMNCPYLAEIGSFDMSGWNESAPGVDWYHDIVLNTPKMTRFGGYGATHSWDISSTGLQHDAILEVFNNLGTVDETAGITLTLGSDKLALMSDEEKAIATGKGWVLA